MTVVVLGDVMADVVARHAAPLARGSDTPARVALHGGGGAGNLAAWLARAGAEARLVACAGDDALAAVALAGLGPRAAAGVRRVAGARTGICIVLVGPDGERTMLPDAGANLELSTADAREVEGEVLHVSGYALLRRETREAARAALARARATGMRTSVDPSSAAPLAELPEFLGLLGAVDLLLPNEDEAAVLGERMWEVAREVVVKRGAAGATWSDGTRSVAVPAASPAGPVVDTTGAGDAFAAGVLSAWPGDPAAALRRGAALAAEAVTRTGARPGAAAG